MKPSAVEQVFGKLSCADKPAGYRLCTGSNGTGETVKNLELFFYEDRVLSLSYEVPIPDDPWSHLESLVTAYGEPTLKGLADKDKKGRLHEIYGWKDESTIYSVRFIWLEDGETPGSRRLSDLAVTLWDRAAYLKWEKDPARVQTPTSVPQPMLGAQATGELTSPGVQRL